MSILPHEKLLKITSALLTLMLLWFMIHELLQLYFVKLCNCLV